jgi:glutaminyl-tRNA synthetase
MANERKGNFITEIIERDIKDGAFEGGVKTRFPPEPNGYLHIGHAKSICLNFQTAKEYGGTCNLRFDDTNPSKEETEYVESIKRDVKWLGFDWDGRLYYASDYFDRLYECAETLINREKAYVCDLSQDEIKEYRGTLTEPGKDSPYRSRSARENLELFRRMRDGEFPDGSRVLRAKIDMSHPNMVMRDPALYRIKHESHHRTGGKWCIYPMYDLAHCISDSIERITHSLCTLEFENNRPLYDWILDALGVYHPRQIEFARLNLSHTVLSKRKLLQLVSERTVDGWDDPRMPTLSGLRRRGYTPESIRNFCDAIGVAKFNSTVDLVVLENSLRGHLNKTAPRVMAVLRPLEVVIENYPDDKSEELDAVNNPEDASFGTRKVPFSKVIYIEREDFMENPPKKFFRLCPGREVRLRYAYFIKCKDVVKGKDGSIRRLICTYDPETRGGDAPDGRKVKATLHWVSAAHAIDAEVRLFNPLFSERDPGRTGEDTDFMSDIARDSLEILKSCKLEPSLKNTSLEARYQFERLGYFCVDSKYSTPERIIFNRSVTLRDYWSKIKKSGTGKTRA